MINPQLQAEIDTTIRKLYKITNQAKRNSQRALRKAARPLIAAIKERAPVSTAPHSRYSGGQIAATYYPGNLKRSFKTLTFRRSAAVFVGPKLDKGGSKGVFGGARTDGYYAHWVEYGTDRQRPLPFVRPAAAVAGEATLRIAVNELKAEIDKAARAESI